MNLIKKKFLINTGCTSYNFNILLTASIKDFGIFDTVLPVYIVNNGYGYNYGYGYGYTYSDSEGLGLNNLS
jgi:hypothetical protein